MSIKIDELSYQIDDKLILDRLNIDIEEKNQIIGIIGANGSGKTTLLRHIYRNLKNEW